MSRFSQRSHRPADILCQPVEKKKKHNDFRLTCREFHLHVVRERLATLEISWCSEPVHHRTASGMNAGQAPSDRTIICLEPSQQCRLYESETRNKKTPIKLNPTDKSQIEHKYGKSMMPYVEKFTLPQHSTTIRNKLCLSLYNHPTPFLRSLTVLCPTPNYPTSQNELYDCGSNQMAF